MAGRIIAGFMFLTLAVRHAICDEVMRQYLLTNSLIDSCSTLLNSLEGLSCNRLLWATFAVSSKNTQQGTSYVITLDEALVASTGLTEKFKYPITINLKLGPTAFTLPATFVAEHNAQPYEESIERSPCVAYAGSGTLATCGWAMDAAGNNIPHSEGFCCSNCATSSTSRGSQCTGSDSSPVAYCLRMSANWFQTYSLGSYSASLEFATINVSRYINGTKPSSETITISGGTPTAMDSQHHLKMKLTKSTSPTLDALQSLYLSIPLSPPPSMVQDISGWLALDSSLYGSNDSCNLVGSSYDGYVDHPNKCSAPLGDCTNNQLNSYVQKNAAAQRYGSPGPYSATTTYGSFQANMADDRSQLYSITVPQSALVLSYTTFAVAIAADNIEFLPRVYQGSIVDLKALPYNSSDISTRIVTVDVTNAGAKVTNYTLTLNCTTGIVPYQSVPLMNLLPNTPKGVNFTLNFDTDVAPAFNCSAYLFDIQNHLQDWQTVTAYPDGVTKSVSEKFPPLQVSSLPRWMQYPVQFLAIQLRNCSGGCANSTSVNCQTFHTCWSAVMSMVGALALAIVTTLTLVALIRHGRLGFFVSQCALLMCLPCWLGFKYSGRLADLLGLKALRGRVAPAAPAAKAWKPLLGPGREAAVEEDEEEGMRSDDEQDHKAGPGDQGDQEDAPGAGLGHRASLLAPPPPGTPLPGRGKMPFIPPRPVGPDQPPLLVSPTPMPKWAFNMPRPVVPERPPAGTPWLKKLKKAFKRPPPVVPDLPHPVAGRAMRPVGPVTSPMPAGRGPRMVRFDTPHKGRNISFSDS